MSAPSAPGAATTNSNLRNNQNYQIGASEGRDAEEHVERIHGPGLDVSRHESSLTQYLVPSAFQKNQPIISHYQPQPAPGLAVAQQKTSWESSTGNPAFLKSRLDPGQLQSMSNEAGAEAKGRLNGPELQRQPYGSKRPDWPVAHGVAPSSSVTVLGSTATAGPGTTQKIGKVPLVDQP